MKVIVCTKRGRPPEHRQRRDLGTPELTMRRQLAVGAGDPVLSTTPLGIMLARELIDLDQYGAGERYRMLYGRASGRAQDVGLDSLGGSGDEKELARITEQYGALTGLLLRLGRPVLREIVNVAVFQDRPVWLMFALTNPHKHVWKVVKHHQDFIDLRTGLNELAR